VREQARHREPEIGKGERAQHVAAMHAADVRIRAVTRFPVNDHPSRRNVDEPQAEGNAGVRL